MILSWSYLAIADKKIDKKAILHEISIVGPVVMKYIQKCAYSSFSFPSAGSKVKYIACLLHQGPASISFTQQTRN